MIELVLVNAGSNPLSSEEFRYGWKQLQSAVGPSALWLEVPSTDWQNFRSVLEASARHLADGARVLVLAHGHVLLTHSVLTRLSQALDAFPDSAAVCAYDSRHPPAAKPDYCTLRGMERYLDSLQQQGSVANRSVDFLDAPLVTLTTLGAVRSTQWKVADVLWVGDAYVHDFSDYHQGRREEVVPLIPPRTRRLLDVGGGEGGFLEAAKSFLGCETHLAEWSTSACARARTRVDKVWEGDFFSQDFTSTDGQAVGKFDCVTFLDVLEHTPDPALWLKRASALLVPGGCVVASIPNVGHWGVLADLLEARWDYCPVGIHCITHLRFFTEHSVRALFSESGFEIERLQTVKVPCPAAWSEHWAKSPGLQVEPAAWDDYAFLVRARLTNSRQNP